MKVWKCPSCGQQKRTSDDKEFPPLCSRTHGPVRMELDDVELASDRQRAGVGVGQVAEVVDTPAAADPHGDGIVWRDPPPAPAGRRHDEARMRFVDALRERPGKWAVYPQTSKSNPACGAYAKRHPGTEWTARRRGDVYELYGRWIGGAS